MEMGSGSLGASGSGGSGNTDPLHGLKFGKKIYFGDLSGGGVAGGSSSRAPASPVPALAPASSGGSVSSGSAVALRRGKGVVQGGRQQPPRCQVEGCRVDLTGAKPYYCRHKVCGMHSKSPKVTVAGMEQRFCQQCSRFHQLHEFDQGKRSCRRRLAGHNARRRKPTPGTLKSRYGLLSSSFHEDTGRFGSFLLDFSYPRPPAAARDVWPTVRVDRGSTSQWESGLDTPASSGIMANMTHSYAPGSAGGSLFSSQEIPPSEGLGVSDSSCALSLLSTQPWGTTTDTRIRASTISDHNFGGHPMAQPGAAASFAGNAWSFKGHETGSSTHEIPCEMGLGQAGGPGDGHFSGELELALQGDKHCMDPERGRVYCPPGNLMHWSL